MGNRGGGGKPSSVLTYAQHKPESPGLGAEQSRGAAAELDSLVQASS